MTISVVTAPGAEPVSTDDAKAHLRVTGSDDNSYIDGLIAAARHFAENYTGSVFVKRTLKLTLDAFPGDCAAPIIVPTGPVIAVTAIDYTDTDGNEQSWDLDNIAVDYDPKATRIFPAYEQDWPDTRDEINAVRITFTAGYESEGSPEDADALRAGLPDDFVHAVKMLIGHWYENRMEVVTGAAPQQVPMAALSLLWAHKIKAF